MAVPDGSDPTSLYFEHGRGYCNFQRGQYFLPVDQKEQQRLDIAHTMIQAARPKRSRLHDAPFTGQPNPRTGHPARVLDLGHGTGIWCLEMAEKYKDAAFIGVDLANMDPNIIPPNVELLCNVDFEAAWQLGSQPFDFIHMQMGLGSVGNWAGLYQKIFLHLCPTGWFEHVEVDWKPRCDDGTLNPKGLYSEWWEKYVGPPFKHIGRPIDYPDDTHYLLREQGFINIQHREFRIPTNAWSGNPREHAAGVWWPEVMDSSQDRGFGVEALSLAVLTRIQRWPSDHALRLCKDVMKEACDPNVHAFNSLHIWLAQKPG